MNRGIVLFFLFFYGVMLTGGCQQQRVTRPLGMQPFVPVNVVFEGLRRDAPVEGEIARRLFCSNCPFLKAGTEPTSYCLRIYYDRRMDLKSLGIVVLSAALAPVEAEFTYTLQVKVLEGDEVLHKYAYSEQTHEQTSSALGEMFNPFYDENGRSEDIFAGLTDRFLLDVMADAPLPRVGSHKSQK